MAYFRCGGGSNQNSLNLKGTVTLKDVLDLSAGNSNSTLSCSTKILEVTVGDMYTTLTKNSLTRCSASLSSGKLTITANASDLKYYSESSQTVFTHTVSVSYDVTLS